MTTTPQTSGVQPSDQQLSLLARLLAQGRISDELAFELATLDRASLARRLDPILSRVDQETLDQQLARLAAVRAEAWRT